MSVRKLKTVSWNQEENIQRGNVPIHVGYRFFRRQKYFILGYIPFTTLQHPMFVIVFEWEGQAAKAKRREEKDNSAV